MVTKTRRGSSPLQYWYSLWVVGALALAGVPVHALLGYHAVGFLLLAGLLSLGLLYPFGPVFFAALLSALVWDYGFIPPRFTFTVGSGEDALMIVAFVLASASTGFLTRQIRRKQAELEARERGTRLLYELGNAFSGGPRERSLAEAEAALSQAFGASFCILVAGEQGALDPLPRQTYPFRVWGQELERAQLALRTKRPAGLGGAPGEKAGGFFVPLLGTRDAQGVLVARLSQGESPPMGKERELLESAARRLGLALEREALEQRSREADRLRESEQLHQALLNSVSHELRTPLTALLGSAAGLRDEAALQDPVRRQGLLDELSDAGERLNRVIDNLLDMARLSSGVLAPKRDWQDPAELLRQAVDSLQAPLRAHRVRVVPVAGLPLIHVDQRLIEHALANLLLNAAAYAPAGSEILVEARLGEGCVELSIADQGPGISPQSLPHVFERFYRAPGAPTGGTGLGLYIAQSLLRAHGGEARALNRPAGGAEFILSLPLQAQPQGPEEPS